MKVKLSNLDKLYWPDDGYTKGDLINYYEGIHKFILPHLKGRPMSLKRNPNGIKDNGFFHKDAGSIAPPWMKTADFYSPSSDKVIHYLLCNDLPSLLFIANLGCIELNPWNSTADKPDHPDYFAIDIDPSDQNTFAQVIDVTVCVKEVLDEGKMDSFCKTSGSSGLHIYVPCKKKYHYDEIRDLAKLVATHVNERMPSITTMERSLSKRKKNQIYIDYLQNSRGQTLASAYSVRPKPGAPVSAPLEWKEVKHSLHPSQFTIKNILKRVTKKGDLFKGVLGKGIDLKRAVRLLHK